MRWEDERYVRLYTRDTTTWKMLPWQAKALLPLLLRKLDRAGLMDLGEDSIEAISALTDMPVEVVEAAMPALLKRDTFRITDGRLLMPNFIEAQETRSSDAQRKRDQRERDRDTVRASGQHLSAAGQDITAAYGRKESPAVTSGVTSGHQKSPAVTPSRAVPNLAVPSGAVPSRAEPTQPTSGFEGASLRDEIDRIFREERGAEYAWDWENENAVRTLGKYERAEVLKRWRNGLRAKYPACNAVVDLVPTKNWNAYANDPGKVAKPVDPTKGVTRADAQDWSGDGGFGALNGKGGHS